MHDINLIEEICEEEDYMFLYISDPLEMTLVINEEFLDKFKFDDAILFVNYVNNTHYLNYTMVAKGE